MNTPNPQEIRATLEQRRRRHDEQMRRDEEAMDAFVGSAVQSLAEGLHVVDENLDSWKLGTWDETMPVATMQAMRADTRGAIEARRNSPAGSSPTAEPGEPPLRAALRGIVQDYAEPVTPSEQLVTDLHAFSGVALDEADTNGLWADLELTEVLAVRAAMRDVIDIITDRAESIIIAELVAAQERLSSEYPDVPRPDPADANDKES